MNKFDLVCLGGASYDIILRVPRLPTPDEKLVVQYAGQQAGGLVANTACAAARLGLHVAWAGVVGADAGGDLIRQAFLDFGVNTSLIETTEQWASDFTVILLEPSGERTILVVPTSPLPPPLEKSTRAAGVQARIVYTLPHAHEWFIPIAHTVHVNGGQVAVDLESSSPTQGQELLDDLQLCDIVCCNRRGLALATGSLDPASGAAALLEIGPSCVCVTLGAQGAWGFTRQEQAFAPAFKVPVVDTTGAGDCFHAAFLKAYLDNQPLEDGLRFANAAAALSIQKVGARAGLPTQSEVENFLSHG
jgi:sugar/nucleoside kinase (ribokinase family)